MCFLKAVLLDNHTPSEARMIGFSGVTGALSHSGAMLYQAIQPKVNLDNVEPKVHVDCLLRLPKVRGLFGPIETCLKCHFAKWTHHHIAHRKFLRQTQETKTIILDCPKCKSLWVVRLSSQPGLDIVSKPIHEAGKAWHHDAWNMFTIVYPIDPLKLERVREIELESLVEGQTTDVEEKASIALSIYC